MDLTRPGSAPVYCTIVPPHLLDRLSQAENPAVAGAARRTLLQDEANRSRRLTTAAATVRPTVARAADAKPDRTIHDAQNGTELPGTIVRSEGEEPGRDATVNRAYAGLGATFDLFLKGYERNSIDGNGLPLIATVHYDEKYGNAFWDGKQMVFGDGDGEIFLDFTIPVDVMAHELTHGVTQYTANLAYSGQSGALNESVSDVFGSLVKQHTLGQTADQADWLIGEGLLAPGVQGVALRSMKAPGTAYDDDVLGKDPQPAHMDDYVDTEQDNGGVHINSGIPNHAFYLLATRLGGHARERAGQIWYDVLTGGELAVDCTFADFAKATIDKAAERYGRGEAHEAVVKAWSEVGVPTA
ncbi:M4 family metallopeptidase [Streptomyces sp. B-S-A8]|uniref:Neutral metalloproteinase n=1 Tax=Streptomyces solicavernae TaxID=3043614 RepID=A0ABT6RWU7_9ACTN|nr:M4 family metallopeptidase [Streptomyces sp. B-S-A8]MDI3388644.1 M4 family metallopeptidase [Streptomyces sp. B-S-A8]